MRVFALLLSMAALCLLSCDTAPVCVTQDNCPPEQACVSGGCQDRACFSNGDCAMGEHCELELGQCESGCTEDGDCFFGEQCVAGSCAEKPCTSTAQDCAAGQYCDVFTGSCFDAPDVYCADCSQDSDCGCVNDDCSGNSNNICRYVSGEGPYCLPQCAADYTCPAGYDCVSLRSNGEITSWYCVTLCHQLQNAEDEQMMSRELNVSPFEEASP